jgi:hypothetical protein
MTLKIFNPKILLSLSLYERERMKYVKTINRGLSIICPHFIKGDTGRFYSP